MASIGKLTKEENIKHTDNACPLLAEIFNCDVSRIAIVYENLKGCDVAIGGRTLGHIDGSA